MKNIIKRILAFFLVVYLIIVPPFAYAASPAGFSPTAVNWVNGAATLSAIKDGISVAAKVAPSVARVGKTVVAVGAGGLGVLFALNQITGLALSAVDYVYDNSTSTFKYKSPAITGWVESNKTDHYAATATDACMFYATKYNKKFGRVNQFSDRNAFCYDINDNLYAQLVLMTVAESTKSISLDTVSQKVISNAASDHADSKRLVAPTVIDGANAGEYDTQLKTAYDNAVADNATHNCGSGTHWSGSACVADTPSTPTTPDTPFDPTSIIDAINSVFDAVMSIPSVINAAIDKVTDKLDAKFKDLTDMATDWKDAFVNEYQTVKDKVDHYFNDEPVMTDTPLPESNPTLKDPSEFDKDYIKVTAQCPDDVERQIPVGNMSFTLRFPMSPLCDFLSTYARPVIILMAYITAALSIGNAFRVGG